MKYILSLLLFVLSVSVAIGQQSNANYDESKVPSYILPDPLVFKDGSIVKTKKEWDKRRAELISIFQDEVYGISPEWKGNLSATEISVKKDALDGMAVRREIKITLKNGNKELDFIMLMYLPNSSRPVPIFLGYNFGGNHSVTDENDILITSSWMRNNPETGIVNNKASEAGRGKGASSWQAREIISRGYGLATIYYGDIDPDFDDGFRNGVHSLYDQKPNSSSWGSIAAWAWGLSRAMDYLQTIKSVDAKKVIVMGHSRLGKTSLWAGASDQRFAIVISNNSGCGGAALSMRKFGETVGRINTSFPHMFCDNYNKYNEKEETLPVDQHELIALMAPRPVYVASAEEDTWADPKGEFLSCVGASPVYFLLTGQNFQAKQMPATNAPVTGLIGYHIRTGKHNVTLYDWQRYLDFADMHLKRK
jgi:hypothetical protein